METKNYTLKLSFDEIVELVKQLSNNDKMRLVNEMETILPKHIIIVTKEKITNVMRAIKPYFIHELGKNTHKKTSNDWAFYGLAFTSDEMVYVFGINLGFFKKHSNDYYNYVGMNVLVRIDGEHTDMRQKYLKFFRENLKDWVNQDEGQYESDRSGIGVEFARYRSVSEFTTEDQIVDFLKDCIQGIHQIYPQIVRNPEGIFDNVVRSAPQWKDKIIDICQSHLDA